MHLHEYDTFAMHKAAAARHGPCPDRYGSVRIEIVKVEIVCDA